MIKKWLVKLYKNFDTFNDAIPVYQDVLNMSNFKHKLKHIDQDRNNCKAKNINRYYCLWSTYLCYSKLLQNTKTTTQENK